MADIRITVTAEPSLKNVESEIKKLIERYDGAGISVNIDAKAMQEANAQVKTAEQFIQTLSDTASEGFKQGAAESRKMAQGVKEVDSETKRAGQSIGSMAAKVAQWAVATTLIYAPLRQTKEALEEMKRVDTAMVTIRKVTGATREDMAALGTEPATGERGAFDAEPDDV